MGRKLCFMYSGQGSQYYGMARLLYSENSVFKSNMDKLDSIANGIIGDSIISKMYSSEKAYTDKFDSIVYTHPAIYMVEYSLTQVLRELGLIPDFLMGNSLGELVSMAAAGAISPENMLEFVCFQALLIENKCQPGGMIAVQGNKQVFRDIYSQGIGIELAAVIHNNQFVISGNRRFIDLADHYLKSHKIPYIRLPIAYGFHSSNIDPIKPDYLKLARDMKFGKANIPIYTCSQPGELYEVNDQILWMIIRGSFDFIGSLEIVSKMRNTIFVDLGPSGMLSNNAKVILRKRDGIYSIITPFNTEGKRIKQIINDVCTV